MAQGTPLDIAEKTSEKTGNRYYSINAGSLGTIVVYPSPDDDTPVRCFLYARQPKDEARPANLIDMPHRPRDKPRPASKDFYNDAIPDFTA